MFQVELAARSDLCKKALCGWDSQRLSNTKTKNLAKRKTRESPVGEEVEIKSSWKTKFAGGCVVDRHLSCNL